MSVSPAQGVGEDSGEHAADSPQPDGAQGPHLLLGQGCGLQEELPEADRVRKGGRGGRDGEVRREERREGGRNGGREGGREEW